MRREAGKARTTKNSLGGLLKELGFLMERANRSADGINVDGEVETPVWPVFGQGYGIPVCLIGQGVSIFLGLEDRVLHEVTERVFAAYALAGKRAIHEGGLYLTSSWVSW